MKIQFEELRLRNFLSIGNREKVVEFPPGVHLVTGYNYDDDCANGCGKSAILCDGLMFALFGTMLRKINLDDIINKVNGRNCESSIKFNIKGTQYQIVRTLNPNTVALYIDGEEQDYSNKRELERRIRDILRCGPGIYKNTNILSLNYNKPFLDLSLNDKRTVIENLLGITIYSDMWILVRSIKKEQADKMKILESDIAHLNRHITSLRNNIKYQTSKEAEQLQRIRDSLKEIKNRVKELRAERAATLRKISNIKNNLENYDTIVGQERRRSKQLAACTTECKLLKHNITTFKEYLRNLLSNERCPQCGINLKEENRLEAQIKKYRAMIENLTQKLDFYKKKEEILKKQLQDIVTKRSNLDTQKQQLKILESQIETIDDSIQVNISRFKEEKQRRSSYEIVDMQEYHQLQTELNVAKEQLKITSEENVYYEFITQILSDSGVRSYVFRKVLPIINMRLKAYLRKLGLEFDLEFNTTFDATIRYRKQHQYKYHNLSGGQKRRVDLALLLTFIDLVKMENSLNSNVLVLDEVLDSSLDYDGISRFLDILHHRTLDDPNIAIFLITHRDELSTDARFDRIYTVEKRNGFSNLQFVELSSNPKLN